MNQPESYDDVAARLESAIAELKTCLGHGTPRDLHELVDKFQLETSPAHLVELIYADYHLKRNAGQFVTTRDYLDQFPEHIERLEKLFQCEQLTTITHAASWIDSSVVEWLRRR